jgi:Protein of unknown function (DUF2924)
MESNISKQIAKLPSFSRQQLLDLWRKVHGAAAPPGIRRELMVPFLAYRMQEKIYGGLGPTTSAELRRIARDLKKPGWSIALKPRSRIKPGTRLIRKWHGETHEIVATESGYEYRGTLYRSLSKIACKITGTRWSGPAFFGLNRATHVQRPQND